MKKKNLENIILDKNQTLNTNKQRNLPQLAQKTTDICRGHLKAMDSMLSTWYFMNLLLVFSFFVFS